MTIFLTVLLSVTALAIVGVWGYRQAQRLGQRLNAWRRPRGVTFGLHDVPLSPQEWERFANLAGYLGITQKTLLADCVKFYLQEHRNNFR